MSSMKMEDFPSVKLVRTLYLLLVGIAIGITIGMVLSGVHLVAITVVVLLAIGLLSVFHFIIRWLENQVNLLDGLDKVCHEGVLVERSDDDTEEIT